MPAFLRRAERHNDDELCSEIESIQSNVTAKLDRVRALLAEEITGKQGRMPDVQFPGRRCSACRLAIELDAELPILFLDTGYHFKETYEYRDRMTRRWHSEPHQSAAHCDGGRAGAGAWPALSLGARPMLQIAQGRAAFCKAVAEYRVWLTGLRREQAKSRAALEESRSLRSPEASRCSSLRHWPNGLRAMSGTPANSCRFRCCRSTRAVILRSAASHVPRFLSIPTIPAPAAGPARKSNAASTSRQRHLS
jgi:hypothetical protein